MKTTLIRLIGILFIFTINLQAQNSKANTKYHKVWITKFDNTKNVRGILYEVSNKSLKILDNHSREIVIAANTIETVKIRRKGKIGKGLLIGALAGAATGAIIGLASGDEPDKIVDGGWLFGTYTAYGTTAGEKAGMLGISLGFFGGITGAILGTKKEKFQINGDIKKYEEHVKKLQNYSPTRTD
jgi:hypothetical protein